MDNSVNKKHPAGGYGSVEDLPSVAEMLQHLRAFKLITRVIARSQREAVLELDRQLRELTATVDKFYAVPDLRKFGLADCSISVMVR